MAAIELTASTQITNTKKTSVAGNVTTFHEPSADLPDATAVDTTAYACLKLVATLTTGAAGNGDPWDADSDEGFMNGRLSLRIETGPSDSGPWRLVHRIDAFEAHKTEFVVSPVHNYTRAVWARPRGPLPPVTVLLDGEAI